MNEQQDKPERSTIKTKLHEIIFEADTPAGKAFDIGLIFTILLSVLVVKLESVADIRQHYGPALWTLEWSFTIAFTLEYLLRLSCVDKPRRYAGSFYGVVDVLAILPTYVSLLFPGTHSLLVIRTTRILRVFRVFKLVQYWSEARTLARALRASHRKIVVFLYVVMILVIIIGAFMYLIEGEQHGFTSIPRSIYWAIVTLTTVGYGDIAPATALGQTLAAMVMILGYGIIAVPTGIVTAELARDAYKPFSTQACPACSAEGHDADAVYCKYCGAKL
jgi:voltage-gated potassium channel